MIEQAKGAAEATYAIGEARALDYHTGAEVMGQQGFTAACQSGKMSLTNKEKPGAAVGFLDQYLEMD